MPSHREQRVLPYRPAQIFDLVADVERYPKFLPWCVGARVYNPRKDGFDADLIIGFKMIRERFTTQVQLMPRDDGDVSAIRVEYIKGPLKYLHNEWRFEPSDGGTAVSFSVDFEFKSRILEKLIGALFEESVHRMVGAFEKRAHEIYGDP